MSGRAAPTRAEQLREARELFQRAQALGCTPTDARKADAAARWHDADRRLADRRQGAAPNGERQLAWWQR